MTVTSQTTPRRPPRISAARRGPGCQPSTAPRSRSTTITTKSRFPAISFMWRLNAPSCTGKATSISGSMTPTVRRCPATRLVPSVKPMTNSLRDASPRGAPIISASSRAMPVMNMICAGTHQTWTSPRCATRSMTTATAKPTRVSPRFITWTPTGTASGATVSPMPVPSRRATSPTATIVMTLPPRSILPPLTIPVTASTMTVTRSTTSITRRDQQPAGSVPAAVTPASLHASTARNSTAAIRSAARRLTTRPVTGSTTIVTVKPTRTMSPC